MQLPNTDKLLLPGTYVKLDVQTDLMDGLFLVDQNTVNREVVQWISDGGSTVFKG